MLTFHINRAGKGLDPQQKQVLEDTRGELRCALGRERGSIKARRKTRFISRREAPHITGVAVASTWPLTSEKR